MREEQVPFFRFAMNCSVEHKDAFRAQPIGSAVAETFDALTSQSVADQQRIEDADDLDFDTFLANYLSLPK